MSSADTTSRRYARARFALLAVLLAVAAAFALTQDFVSADRLREAVDGSPYAAVVFIALYALLTVLLVPGALGSAAAGALFGAVWGTALTLVGATLGATLAFVLARVLGRAQVERYAGGRIASVDRWLTDRGLGAVLFLRLVPLFPFNAVNYGAGLSGLPARTYVVGTAIGILPGTVAYVGLGAGLSDPGSTTFLASLGLLAALTAAGFLALRLPRVRSMV